MALFQGVQTQYDDPDPMLSTSPQGCYYWANPRGWLIYDGKDSEDNDKLPYAAVYTLLDFVCKGEY